MSRASNVAVGDWGCALDSNGNISCSGGWTDNSSGSGFPGAGASIAESIVSSAVAIGQVAAGGPTCAILSSGDVGCWSMPAGQPYQPANPPPVSVARIPDTTGAQAVATGGGNGCIIDRSGSVACWSNFASTSYAVPTPTTVAGISTPVDKITAGSDFGCALSASSVLCWGDNGNGELGDGTTTSRATASSVDLQGAVALDVFGGVAATCALTADGRLWCWGADPSTAWGVATTPHVALTPSDVGDSAIVSAALGHHHACAITADNNVWCWGENNAGEIGNGVVGAPVAKPTLASLNCP